VTADSARRAWKLEWQVLSYRPLAYNTMTDPFATAEGGSLPAWSLTCWRSPVIGYVPGCAVVLMVNMHEKVCPSVKVLAAFRSMMSVRRRVLPAGGGGLLGKDVLSEWLVRREAFTQLGLPSTAVS
jgi:hypothetical protein